MKSLKSAMILVMVAVLRIEALSQGETEPDVIKDNRYYVVVGVFAIHDNATNFVKQVTTKNVQAGYALNTERAWYYVYALQTIDRDKAVQEAQRLRTETDLYDTWVYHGLMLDSNIVANNDVVQNENIASKSVSSVEGPLRVEQDTTSQKSASSVVALPAENLPVPHESQSIDEKDGKRFFFRVFRANDEKLIEGDVDAIDTGHSRKIGSYKANTSVLLSPNTNTGEISFICDIFGYRRVQNSLDFKDPLAMDGISQDAANNIVVPFEMVRLKKGDIAVMYNVYFFKDAAVMRPESNYEVNSLVEMLKENPKYMIKIHGHTNGGAYGKIVFMGDSKSFFSLSGTKDGFGSAKELSEERAKVIREFLIESGIEKERMQIKAWGGKKPVHDKRSAKAQENVRVEIEILED
jgi:outer membrane protein OmpA-like peptidoglycan-associated protein